MTLQQRIDTALELRKKGYNCASAVALAFPDVTGLPHDTVLKMTNALGTGIAGTRELCGAAAAMAIVQGFRLPPDAALKGQASAGARALIERFADRNKGCRRCADLKERQPSGEIRSCNELVTQCVEILHDSLGQ